MKKLKLMKVVESIKWNKAVYAILLVFSFIVFKEVLEEFATNSIVKYVLSYVKSWWLNDIIFGSTAILFFCIAFFKKSKGYIVSYRTVLSTVLILIVYCYYRFASEVWEFTSFYLFGRLKYFDILFIVFICVLSLFSIRLFKKKESVNSSSEIFLMDTPIGESDDDILGYKNYAFEVTERIKNSNFLKAFAIGINGKWGIGKTSFINLVKDDLKKEEFIEVNFNPWNSNTPKAIIQDFFETFQEAIKPYHSSISSDLLSYSNKLVSINDNSTNLVIQAILGLLFGNESVNNLHKKIDKKIEAINRKIIIYIDDLDRLDNEEIIEVIRLIRNTANFRSTFFLVAYDREYVLNAIKGMNSHKEGLFLEKIFQIEISLPLFNKELLRQELINKLKEVLNSDLHAMIEKVCDKLDSRIFKQSLTNLRDITRLVNSLSLNFSNLLNSKDIEFYDCLILEILRLKYPSVYFVVFNNPLDILSIIVGTDRYFVLKKVDKDTKNLEVVERFKDYYSETDLKQIVTLLSSVFSDGKDLNYDLYYIPKLSVIYASKFNRYSSYSLFGDKITEIEFGKAMDLSLAKLSLKIDEWVSKGLEDEVELKFISLRGADNRENFEKIIRGVFYLGRKEASNSKKTKNSYIGYNTDDLYIKLYNVYDVTSDSFYNGSKTKYKEFVVSLFNEAPSPYRFESNFLYNLNLSRTDSYFPLSLEERNAFILTYIYKYAKEYNSFDTNLRELFLDSKIMESKTFPEEAIQSVLEVARNEDLSGFLTFIIRENPREEKSYYINFRQFFDSEESFEGFLSTLDEKKWDCLREFDDFYQKLKENDNQSISFNFKILSISDNDRENRKEVLFGSRK